MWRSFRGVCDVRGRSCCGIGISGRSRGGRASEIAAGTAEISGEPGAREGSASRISARESTLTSRLATNPRAQAPAIDLPETPIPQQLPPTTGVRMPTRHPSVARVATRSSSHVGVGVLVLALTPVVTPPVKVMTSLQRHVTATRRVAAALQSPAEQIVRAPIFEFGMSVMPQGRDEARPSPTWLAPSGARREARVGLKPDLPRTNAFRR